MVKKKVILKNYTKDNKKFLKKASELLQDNLKINLKEERLPMIRNNFFPKNKIIMELYREMYITYYTNLQNSSLSVAMELLEYLTRKIYQNKLNSNYPTKNWDIVLKELINQHYQGDLKILLECVLWVKNNIRNKQNHGNIYQLVDVNALFYHEITNMYTMNKTQIPIKYNEKIHGEKAFYEAKDKIQAQNTAYSICLINDLLIHFFIIQNKEDN